MDMRFSSCHVCCTTCCKKKYHFRILNHRSIINLLSLVSLITNSHDHSSYKSHRVHPHLTCPLKRGHVKRTVVFQPLFFRGLVSFLGSKCHRFSLWFFPKLLQHQPKCFCCWIITWTWCVFVEATSPDVFKNKHRTKKHILLHECLVKTRCIEILILTQKNTLQFLFGTYPKNH